MEKDTHQILVIEDDASVAAGLVTGLRKAGYSVELASDGSRGVEMALSTSYDLIILDLMLPERDGFDVLDAWRDRLSTPVVVLSARTDLEARLKSFSLGAVDYLPKPFWMEELVARIRSRLRIREDDPHRVISWGTVKVDLDARTVSVSDNDVELTSHEFNILAFLVERPGRAVSRRQLAENALPESGARYDRTVDSHLSRIRSKLGTDCAGAIKTVWGVGYKFEPESEA